MMRSGYLANSVSLSRIPIALLFVVSFKPDKTLLWISVGLAVAAFVTDIADGYIARKLDVASVQGRHVDSLSDKAFYIAVIISYHDNGLLGLIITWALLVRDVALYATRIMQINKIEKLDQTRFYTKSHGYLIYAMMIFGFIEMFSVQYQIPIALDVLYWTVQVTAWAALYFGVASIVAYLKLD
jgi:cardiolipin synthase